jgi:hypothetical protein
MAAEQQWWMIYGAVVASEPMGVHLVEATDLEEALRNQYSFGRLVRFEVPPQSTQPCSFAAGPFDTPQKALALEPVWARQRVLNSLAVRSNSGSKAEEGSSPAGGSTDSGAVEQALGN